MLDALSSKMVPRSRTLTARPRKITMSERLALAAFPHGLRDGQVSVLVGHESAFVHVPGQDPVQDRGAGQGGLSVDIRVRRVEGVQPEDQRLDVEYDVLDVVLHEGQQLQAAIRDRLPPDRGRVGQLAQGCLHAGHIALADLLGDEVTAGPQMRGDRGQVEWRVPVEDHVEGLWYRLEPVGADPEAEICRRIFAGQPHHVRIYVDPQSMTE